MPSTRSGRSGPASSPTQAATNKRKADASSPSNDSPKTGKKAKQQMTIEETIDPEHEVEQKATNGHESSEQQEKTTDPAPAQASTDASDVVESQVDDEPNQPSDKSADQKPDQPSVQQQDVEMTDSKPDEPETNTSTQPDETPASQQNGTNGTNGNHQDSKQAVDAAVKSENQSDDTSKENEAVDSSDNKADKQDNGNTTRDAVQEDKHRAEAMPSNILEKGIIYFFTRGRVGMDSPDSVQDLQRSFFVLRPLPKGGKITDGSIQDSDNSRLFALPKKVWPKSASDKFMVFVEKAKVSMHTLKKEFFHGSEYSTQTVGVRTQPAVSPIGEGVYAITTAGGGQGTTHLAYMLTVPSELGDVQKDVGIKEKGSFALSLKNPESKGPAYASLPEKPDYPQDFIDEFRGRGWMPVQPKHLDYANAQLLLIGEDFESSNNLEAKPKDAEDDTKVTPEEELQKLKDEDEHRVDALQGDNTVFLDLDISKKDYGLMTTW